MKNQINEELHRKFKMVCVKHGLKMGQVLNLLIEDFISKKELEK